MDVVSEFVRKTFLCAHCRQPITDEFVVGIKLIAPGTFGVFFHKNRKECVAASKARRAQRIIETRDLPMTIVESTRQALGGMQKIEREIIEQVRARRVPIAAANFAWEPRRLAGGTPRACPHGCARGIQARRDRLVSHLPRGLLGPHRSLGGTSGDRAHCRRAGATVEILPPQFERGLLRDSWLASAVPETAHGAQRKVNEELTKNVELTRCLLLSKSRKTGLSAADLRRIHVR